MEKCTFFFFYSALKITKINKSQVWRISQLFLGRKFKVDFSVAQFGLEEELHANVGL
jgi:hypothetical protein